MTTTPTREEVQAAGLVLGKIATADQWAAKPDAAMAVTWAECFAVHGLQRADLIAGVVALYADDTRDKANRTLPADVIRYARKIRRDRMEREKITGDVDRAALAPGRRAIADCPLCDPSGWIERADGTLARCSHAQQVGGAA